MPVDVASFEHTVRVLVTAKDIRVGGSDYPTEAIAAQARAARDIGVGYTNLGASLMALGLPYDSEAGRSWAAAVTGILTGAAAVRAKGVCPEAGLPHHGASRDHRRRSGKAATDPKRLPSRRLPRKLRYAG